MTISLTDGGDNDERYDDSLHPSALPLSASGSVLDCPVCYIDTIDDRKREKRNAAWEDERQQLEKERALREVEYHEARMKELDKS